VLGASFDPPGDNKTFADNEQFGYRLLSDVDHAVGRLYDAVRGPDERGGGFARRIAYLIDPGGVIREAYQVTDTEGFADQVLADLRGLQAS